MPESRRRPFFISAALSIVLLASIALPASAASATPPGIDHFLQALSHVESGGRYSARNPHTGAYGKYQVLPSTWRSWARAYLGSSRARPTPENQERVVRAVVTSAYWKFGRWEVVAYWWLNGRAQRNTGRWDRYSRRYVGKVMSAFQRYGGIPASAPTPPPTPTPTPSPTDQPSGDPTPSASPAPAPTDQPSPSPTPVATTSPSPTA